jgi:hypothetical protein
MEEYYGIKNEEAAIQFLGMITTRQDRLIAFPNVLQHCVQPFRLEDSKIPGHRKILAMFLIDPHIRVISTANVPPQRRDWWAEKVREIEQFAALPREIFDRIIQGVEDFPISWEAAVKIRESLMNERGAMTETINESLQQVSSSALFLQLGADFYRRHSAFVNIEKVLIVSRDVKYNSTFRLGMACCKNRIACIIRSTIYPYKAFLKRPLFQEVHHHLPNLGWFFHGAPMTYSLNYFNGEIWDQSCSLCRVH